MTDPVIHSVSPPLGANDLDVSITILGTGFDASPDVFIGSVACTSVVRPDANTINCNVPAGILPEAYNVRVVNTGSEEFTLLEGFRVIYPLVELPFTSETQAVVLARMLSGLDTDWDVSPPTFVYALLSTAALEIARIYTRADDTIRQFFPQNARLGYLDSFGEAFGLTRNISVKATGSVTVSGTNGTVVPAGTRFSTQVAFGQNVEVVEFETDTDGTISGGSVVLVVTALEPGITGNVSAGQILRIISAVAGITSVTNPSATSGGLDKEDDQAYRIRLLNFVQDPIAGGNKQDYITWALEVEDVGRASCVPLGRGDGTVDVNIIDENTTDGVHAVGVLDLTDQPTDTNTVVIDSKTYTFQATLTDVDGNVHIGADVEASIANLVNAIKLGPGAGTDYADLMTLHPTVFAAEGAGDTMDATAKDAGTAGDSIATTETLSDGSWTSGATLGGGLTAILADSALILAVQNFIAPAPVDEGGGRAPIGADVDVDVPSPIYVAVTADIVVVSGFVLASVITSVKAALNTFVDALDIGEDVKTADLANVIHDTAGVDNYSGFLVDWLSADIPITDSQVAIIGILDIF